MSFASTQLQPTQDMGRRWATLASVAVLHAGALYVLVIGLAGVVTMIEPRTMLKRPKTPGRGRTIMRPP